MDCGDVAGLLSTHSPADLAAGERAEVDAHLAGCSACRDRWSGAYESCELHLAVEELDTPRSVRTTVMARIGGETPRTPGSQRPPREFETPQQIGGFEVLGFLGRGGMGNVFKARQVSMDRLVALKLLPARLAEDERFVERLTREARAAARLSHPNIVHAYDVGEADGHCYFAMEYIDGEGLDAVLRRRGPLEPERARRIMTQVASALAAAHDAGVIHRDIKPSNILIDAKGRARVTDFGLAKRLEGDATSAAIGESLGTPAYAAPEVCRGAEIDARADLYSLGATFFHLLAGRPPFEDADAARVLVRQVKDDPPALAAVAPRVDPRLCRIIDRLLCKDPSERHPSARALLDELEALGKLRPNGGELQEAPTESLRPGQKLLREFEAEQGRGPRWTRGRRIALVGGAIAACIALALVLWPGGGPRGGRPSGRAKGKEAASAIEATPGERNEHNAEATFRRAERAASQGLWVTVIRELDRLEQMYADTRFCASHRAAIAELRARATEELRPRVTTPRPEAAPGPPAPAPELPERPGEWFELFDGESLRGWRVVEGEEFVGHGPVHVAQGCIVLPRGPSRAAVAWTGDFPTVDYELEVEMRRQEGEELCEILFPVGSVQCAWNIGGWSGRWAGLGIVERKAANDNDTTRATRLRTGQWYRARLRVTEAKVEAWLDDEEYVDLERAGRGLSHPYWLPVPEALALFTWRSTLGLRNIRLRRLASEPEQPPADGSEVEAAAVVVAAKGSWFDTGLYLAKGTPYDISATGRWGANTAWNDGPGGAPRQAFRGHPFLGPRLYDLIGRVGGQGRPFHVGDQLQLAPAQPGRLYLRMNDNDDGVSDNWGSLRVSIRGPMVADKAAPLMSRFPKTIAQVQVGRNGEWTSSGVDLRRGDMVLLSADGQWDAGPRRGAVDANGWNQTWRGQRAGALIGRIGERGVRFTIGKLHLLEAREPGRLYLAVNDPRRATALPGADLPGVRLLVGPALRRARAQEPAGALTVTVRAAAAFEQPRKEPEERDAPECRLLATLKGHSSWVISVAFSPDGKLLASGGRDTTARIWDAATGQCLKILRGHHLTVEAVAFSPDGKHLLTASGDKTLRLWDVATGGLVKALPGHQKWVRSAAFFPGGERVASTGADETARIWELAGAPRARALPCGAACWIVAVSPDGGKVAVVTERGWIRIWDADTGHTERAFFAQTWSGWALAFSPDGQRLVSAGGDPLVKVWDVGTGQRLATLALDGKVRSVAFSPDGRYLATADGHRAVRIWDAVTYEHLRSVEDHTDEARGIAFSPDGKRFATASFDGTVKLWALDEALADVKPGPAPPEDGGGPDAAEPPAPE